MLPRINNAAQGAAMQHLQDVQAPRPQHQVHLGSTQSIGTTVARVLGAILTFGLSEVVIAIVRAVRNARAERAQPHLPANQHRRPAHQPHLQANQSDQARRAIRMLNKDFVGETNNGRHLMQAMYVARDREFAHLAPRLALTSRDTIDNVNFREQVQKAIIASPTLVTPQELPALATKVAHNMLVDNFIQQAFDDALPAGYDMAAVQFNAPRERCLNSADMTTLLTADPATTDIVAVRNKVRSDAGTYISSKYNNLMACKEMIAEGLQRFQTMTGLDTATASTLNTRHLVSKFESAFRPLFIDPTVNARTKDDFRAVHQKAVNDFFAGRAEVYNSITTLCDTGDLPPALASKWQHLYLETDLKLPPTTFAMAQAAAKAASGNVNFEELAHPSTPDQQFIKVMHTMSVAQFNVRMNVFGGTSNDLGPEERTQISTLIAEHVVDSIPSRVRTELANQADRLDRIQEQTKAAVNLAIEELGAIDQENLPEGVTEEAADRAARQNMELVGGTDEFFMVFRAALNNAAHRD